jgi:hypothetical protein
LVASAGEDVGCRADSSQHRTQRRDAATAAGSKLRPNRVSELGPGTCGEKCEADIVGDFDRIGWYERFIVIDEEAERGAAEWPAAGGTKRDDLVRYKVVVSLIFSSKYLP